MPFEIGLPKDFQVTCDYDSHRPLLYIALEKVPRGTVCELGCGNGSTASLLNHCNKHARRFFSYETNFEWWRRFSHMSILWPGPYSDLFMQAASVLQPALLFIDSAPGEERKALIEQWRADAQVIIVHDTEPGAEYVYGMAETLNSFPYRVDLHIPGNPSTTAVSQTIDVSFWKQYSAGGYKLV